MKVIIYRDKETKQIVRDAGDDYELLKARGKTDEDIAALVEEFNGRENCPQTVEIVELDEVAEFYRTRKLNAYKEQLNDFAFMEDRLDELSRMIENYIDEARRTENGMDVRELRKVKLFDVSPVTFPAYTATDVGVRAMQEYEGYKAEQRRQTEEAAQAAAQKAREQAKFKRLKTKIKNL